MNQSGKFREWARRCSEAIEKNDFWEMTFHRNSTIKSFSFHFMEHITKINRCFPETYRVELQWEKELDFKGGLASRLFYKLDNLLQDLEENCRKDAFDVYEWSGKYIRELDVLKGELLKCK